MEDNTLELVWRGYGRVQPNKDWRARTRNHANEFNATHAMRVQIPINKNLLGAVYDVDGNIVSYGIEPIFAKDFVLRVMEAGVSGTEELVGVPLTVRNALNSSTPWVHNLLCDAGTK